MGRIVVSLSIALVLLHIPGYQSNALAAGDTVAQKSRENPHFLLDGKSGWTVDGKPTVPPAGTLSRKAGLATLTTDLPMTLVITGENLILEGDGHSIIGGAGGGQTSSQACGILVEGDGLIRIRNLKIRNFLFGVCLSGASHVIVENSDIENCASGIFLDNAADNTIAGNRIVKNNNGIHIQSNSRSNVIDGNEIRGNRRFGITMVAHSNQNLIRGNNIFFNGLGGISINQESNSNTVLNNNISFNDRYGVILQKGASHNRIYNNNFMANRYKHAWVEIPAVGNLFSMPAPTGGNYWGEGEYSAFPGSSSPAHQEQWAYPDADRDGVVDNPYPVYILYSERVYVMDELPWSRPFHWFPRP